MLFFFGFNDFIDFLTYPGDGAELSPFILEEPQNEDQPSCSVNHHQDQTGDDVLHYLHLYYSFAEAFPGLSLFSQMWT